MQTTTSMFAVPDGTRLFLRRWLPDAPAAGGRDVVGSVEIAHGMGEHSARYARLAEALTGAGWATYAHDERGHGHTALGEDGSDPSEPTGMGELGDLGPGGWDGLVGDLGSVNDLIRAQHPDTPRVLLGHSMGSFAAQQFALDHSREIDGLVLSGTTAVDVAATVLDPDAGSDLVALNAGFQPARTDFDWLSRDEAEVDRYVADPLCGFGLDPAATRSLIAAAPRLADPAALAGIRPDLPDLPGGRVGRPAEPRAGHARDGGRALPGGRRHRHHDRLPPGCATRGLQRDQPGRDHRPPAGVARAVHVLIGRRTCGR